MKKRYTLVIVDTRAAPVLLGLCVAFWNTPFHTEDFLGSSDHYYHNLHQHHHHHHHFRSANAEDLKLISWKKKQTNKQTITCKNDYDIVLKWKIIIRIKWLKKVKKLPWFQHEPTSIRILNSSNNWICNIQNLFSKSKSSVLKVLFRCQTPSLLGWDLLSSLNAIPLSIGEMFSEWQMRFWFL